MHECQRCGACCSSYRVSFYWAEADDAPEGIVPAAQTEHVNLHLRRMKISDSRTLRCACLTGEIGQGVSCSIYENRPSPCREFSLHGEDGVENVRCNEARARHGLPPIQLEFSSTLHCE